MTLTASSSSTHQGRLSEAGPLPMKRGEIGYAESAGDSQQGSPLTLGTPLPSRHPADRDPLPSATHTVPLTPAGADTPSSPQPPGSDAAHTTPKTTTVSIWNSIIFAGLRLGTFILFFTQLALFALTISAWVIAITYLSRTNGGPMNSAVLFIHVGCVAFLIIQFILLERTIYRLRAERYNFLHPGEILPTSRRSMGTGAGAIPFSPWNRPPLPTYAAALAQSGAGTGDAEDHLIAVPPPPAYGNTRGSRMLLTGYLRESLRAQRPASEHSQRADGQGRPQSYISRDERWEAIQDAERARRLEETLARLEQSSEARSS